MPNSRETLADDDEDDDVLQVQGTGVKVATR